MEALRKAPDPWICSNLMLGFLDFFEFLVPKKNKKIQIWALGPGPWPWPWPWPPEAGGRLIWGAGAVAPAQGGRRPTYDRV